MIARLKSSMLVVVHTSPALSANGKWFSGEFSKYIPDLLKRGFNVRGIVPDNHFAHINASKVLLLIPGTNCKTYMFFLFGISFEEYSEESIQ